MDHANINAINIYISSLEPKLGLVSGWEGINLDTASLCDEGIPNRTGDPSSLWTVTRRKTLSFYNLSGVPTVLTGFTVDQVNILHT
jgi:hypothetical protein